MEPITEAINNITGKSCFDLLIFSEKEKICRLFGIKLLFKIDQITTYDMNINAIIIPGNIPAINNFAIESSIVTP